MKNDKQVRFFNQKPVRALITIRRSMDEVYVSKVARKIDTTYAHCVKTIDQLEEEGYVRTEKRGRKKILELTEEGKEMADSLGEAMAVREGKAPLLAQA